MELLRKKYKIVIHDTTTDAFRNPVLLSEYRFEWTAKRALREYEHMRKTLGFNKWYHRIVDIGFRVDEEV